MALDGFGASGASTQPIHARILMVQYSHIPRISRLRNITRFLVYLLSPRPRPLFSAGKLLFFLLGSVFALSSNAAISTARRWLLFLILYEFVINHGKFFLNDYMGRASDSMFSREGKNLFPKNTLPALAVGVYATLRVGLGLEGLAILFGVAAAGLGLAVVLLQVLYELNKILNVPHREMTAFLLVSANYGLRTVSGIAAIDSAVVASVLGAFAFLWSSCLGGLFLSLYWFFQCDQYLHSNRVTKSVICRYKPGLLLMHLEFGERQAIGRTQLPDRLLMLVTVGALIVAPYRITVSFATLLLALCTYAVVAALGISFIKRVMVHSTTAEALWGIVAAVAIIILASAHVVTTRTTIALPFALFAFAAGTRLFHGSYLKQLLLR